MMRWGSFTARLLISSEQSEKHLGSETRSRQKLGVQHLESFGQDHTAANNPR